MKYLFFILISISFISCETTKNNEDPLKTDKPVDAPIGTLDEQMTRHIRSELKITAIEKYDIKVYKEELNRDDSTDWIITVNLKDRAINNAVKDNKTAKMVELGFMGNYNYFFYMDGKTKTFSKAVVVPSSAKGELIIGFEHITSQIHYDFVVDYKIRNSRRRRFYTINNDRPLQVCENVIYYNLGLEGKETESYVIEYENHESNSSNDIFVYEGTLDQIKLEARDDIYDVVPEIKNTGRVAHVWHYSAQRKMYYMDKP
ncbi:MAG: hypothetical protein HRT57_10245 [Crocinitomicaceae bacterium]|nr:hypothetical protein [Crocinitomicaceae bacterium]